LLRIEYAWRGVSGSWKVQIVLPVTGSIAITVRRGPEVV
jgi:hypothetical protein